MVGITLGRMLGDDWWYRNNIRYDARRWLLVGITLDMLVGECRR